MNDSMKSLNDAGSSSETKTRRVKLTPEEALARRRESNKKALAKFRATNPEYNRDRAKAIKEGTWKPHVKAAAMSVSTDAAPCSSEPPGASYEPSRGPVSG